MGSGVWRLAGLNLMLKATTGLANVSGTLTSRL